MKKDLTNLLLILACCVRLDMGIDPPVQKDNGCYDDSQNCNKPCTDGFSLCKDTIQCDYGYFKFIVDNVVNCVKWQYTYVNLSPFHFEDSLMYICMDCKENSETWQNSRLCTYNYMILNGDTQGTYMRQNLTEPQLYAIIQKASNNANFQYSYSVDWCMGCDSFCDEDSDECNTYTEQYDTIHSGVFCSDGYYFSSNLCLLCEIKHCKSCNPFDQSQCGECLTGYAINWNTNLCDPCFSGCLECEYNYESELICITCQQDEEQFLVPSNNGKSCSSCNYGCQRCYIYYDDNYDEGNKCTQCEPGYIIHNEGYYCEWCSLENCEICYYEYTKDGKTYQTYNLDFPPAVDENSKQKCYKCKQGFQLVTDTGVCNPIDSITDHCINKQGDICLECNNNYILEFASFDQSSCLTDKDKCNKKLKNCASCMLFYSNNQETYQCLRCDSGFYPDIYSGLCVQCQTRCETCWQNTQNYNITQYISLQLQGLNIQQYAKDIESIKKQSQNDPFCSKCQEGFEFYSNQCLGCTDSCVNDDMSQCEYQDDTAYCSKCATPKYQQSLTSDNSECNDCPTNCIACRERTQDEINFVNPFFNPDYSQLVKYSNFCYKMQPLKTSPPPLIEKIRYIDSILGVPITCVKNNHFKGCQFEVTYFNVIDCKALQEKIKKSKSSSYTIFLKDLENAQNYNTQNSQQVTKISIELAFSGSEHDNQCLFSKPIIIQSRLKQNVFTLKTLTITIKSSISEMVVFIPTGSITLQDYSAVTFQDVKFKDPPQGNFGFQILGQTTQLSLINCRIEKTNPSNLFTMLLQNTIYLYFSQVHFEKLRNENFFNQNTTGSYSQQAQYILEDVEFSDCQINDVMFQVNSIGTNNLLQIKNVLFKKSIIANTQIFSDITSNPSYSIVADGVKVINCTFTNSSLFNLAVATSFSASNLESVLTMYQAGSNFIASTAFKIQNCYSYRSNFQNSSELISTNPQIYSSDQQNSLIQYVFKGIIFKESICSNINCLMLIQTPLNSFSIVSNITIEQIYITDLQISEISQKDINSVTSAVVTLQSVGNIIINDIVVKNSLGLSSFFIGQTLDIIINQAVCLLDKDNTYVYRYDSTQYVSDFDINYNLGVDVDVLLTNPYNNLLPNSPDCAQLKINEYQYNSYFIYIEGFSDSVEIDNVDIYNNLFIDRSAIVIKSYQNLQFIQGELITLKNIYLDNNRLASTLNGQEMSLIYINSEQVQEINIINVQYNANHLHQITNSQTSETPLCLLIQSPYSVLQMSESYFNYNRITNSNNGLIWVKLEQINAYDCYFEKTNILDFSWLNYLEESQLVDDDDTVTAKNLRSFFQILSKGANMFIVSKIIFLKRVEITQSFGQQGAGMHFEVVDGDISILNSSFIDIQSSLEATDNTEGGCLSINSETSAMILKIIGVVMQNCKARQRGGCIHIYPTKYSQNILLQDSSFIQCQSFSYAFFSNPFLESTQSPYVYLDSILVTDNNYDNFIQNVPDINLLEQLDLSDSATMYYQNTGSLTLRNCIFNNIKYVRAFRCVQMDRIYIQQSKFQEIIMFLLPIIEIDMNPQNQNLIYFVDTQFIDNQSNNVKSIQQSCSNYFQKGFRSTISTQTCDIIQYLIDYQNFVGDYQIEWNDEQYEREYENQENKLDRPSYLYIYYPDSVQLVSKFNYTLNKSTINCILQSTKYNYDSSGFLYATSLVYVQKLYANSLLKFEKVDIINNECLYCDALIMIENVMNVGLKNSIISLNKMSCKYNIVGYYGCVYISSTDLSYIAPYQSLLDLSTTQSEFRLLQQIDPNGVVVNNSVFSGNKARVGAGITFVKQNVNLINSIFSDNKASLEGGGLFFKSGFDDEKKYLNVFNLTFQNNKAQVGGALYLENAELPDVSALGVTFAYNEAIIQGGNLQETTRRLTISMVEGQQLPVSTYRNMSGDNNDDGNVDSKLDRIRENITLPYQQIGSYPEKTNLLILPSGQSINSYEYFFEETQEYVSFEWIFRIINLNRFNEAVVNQVDGDQCQILGRIQSFKNYSDSQQFTNNFTFPNFAIFSSELGGYILDDMQVFFDPYFDSNYFLELKINCQSLEIPVYSDDYNIIGYNPNYELIINTRTFPCQKGEVYQLSKCIPCSPKLNQYSVIKDAILCQQFNSDYMMEIGQSQIKLKPGYWRPDYDNDQSQFCENLKENCNGGWVPGNPSCYTGHIGALCESCDLYMTINDERYTQTAAYTCARCAPTMQLNYVVLIATSITSFISMVLAVKGSYFSSMQFIIEDTLDKMGILLKSSESDLAVLMKVLTNYFQIIQFIGSFQIALPSSLTQTAKTGGNPTSSTTTAMDCLYVTMSDLDVLYFRMVWSFIQPSIYIVGFYIIYFIGLCLKLVPYKINIITTALIYQFLYLHPTYVEGFIALASPKTISGYQYVQRDVAYRYDSTPHQYYLLHYIMPMLLVWVLVLPFLFMGLVFKNRATLDTKMTKLIYGFFYLEYQLNSYLWEFVKLFQKEFMVIILSYYDEQVTVKGLLLVVVMFLYGFYQIQVSPYSNKRLNLLDRYSTVILSISLAMGVLMKSCQDKDFGYLFIIVGVILIIINVPFLISILYCIFEGYLIKLSPILDKVRDLVNEKYPDMGVRHPWLKPYLFNRAKMAERVKYLWGVLREAVNDTNMICKTHEIKFKCVFPPYDQQGVEFISFRNPEKQPLIEAQQQQQSPSFSPEPETNKIAMQSVFNNGVKQQGQFFTSSFIAPQEQAQPITGKGIEQWPDDTIYEGQIVNGKKEGKGIVKWPLKEGAKQQEFYEGDFINNLFEGYGVYQWADGKKYEGKWKEGKRHGFGRYAGLNQFYEGEFQNDLYHGQGTLTIGDKKVTGHFQEGKMNGEMVVQIGAKRRKGIWKQGKFEKWIN